MVATAVDSVQQHAKDYKGTYMINLFGSIIPIILFVVFVIAKIDGLALDEEVHSEISEHNAGMHPLALTAVGDVQDQLDRMLSIQIEERIEKQLTIICQDNSLREALEPSIKRLIRDYNYISPTTYVRPSCEQLGVK